MKYACHATCNPGGISVNWICYLEKTIRGAMGPDCVVVFLPGAYGDVTQLNYLSPYVNISGPDMCRFVGGCVGAEAVKMLLSMPHCMLSPLDTRIRIIEIEMN